MGNRVHLDGNFDLPVQIGPVVPEDLALERSRLFHVTYLWKIALFLRAKENFNSIGPVGTIMAGLPLVDTSAGQEMTGGVVQFTRTFAEVPRTRDEYALFGYSYQFITTTDGTADTKPPEIVEFAVPVNSRIRYVYYLSATGLTVLKHAYRVAKLGSTIQSIGTFPGVGAQEVLGEDECCERWRGNIWVKKSRYVPARVASVVES